VFRFDPPSTLTTLYSFSGPDGRVPNGALVEGADGNFYGNTSGGGDAGNGTVFRITPSGTLTTLASFTGPNGSSPVGELNTADDGNLYGVTYWGGDEGLGVIFKVDGAGTVSTVRSLSALDDVGGHPHAGLVQASDGKLYGTTTSAAGNGLGAVFKMDTGGTASAVHALVVSDGLDPATHLMEPAAGHLLGTATSGGPGGYGTLFDCDTAGNLAVLHPFTGQPEGLDPVAAVVEGAGGVLFGTAQFGGVHTFGTVFRIDSPGNLTVLHAFDGAEGAWPRAPLAFGQDGRLWGTAAMCASVCAGSVFATDVGGTFQLIHALDGDGSGLNAGLLSASDGSLYGLAQFGGAFRVTTGGSFTFLGGGPNGANGPLLESKGLFYGTTAQGGVYTAGSIFSLDSGGAVTTLYEFQGPPTNTGFYPDAGLVKGTDGAFYGTTLYGGPSQQGTVFRMDADGNVRTIHTFDGGAFYPESGLVQATDGFFYGTTQQGGPASYGTIYRIDFSGTGFSVVHGLASADGLDPAGTLIQTSDGALVGTTQLGGPLHGGVVFRLGLPPSTLAVSGTAPASGPAAGGIPVAIAGSAFVAGATATIGGADAPVTSLVDPTNLLVTTPALQPGTLNAVTVTLPDMSSATLPAVFLADFSDVAGADIFHDTVETIFRDGITAGCGGGVYCRNDPVTRAQMAVFLLKSKNGAGYVPPSCHGAFSDVPCPSLFADWIEDLAAQGITVGCGGGNYCPADPVTRQQMAVFLLKTAYGSAFVPTACTGVFGDVACPGPFSDWIEQLYALQVTGGCSASPLLYCPTNAVSRGQMSAFLVRMFNLS
jgi:uncharacterized repeat protein (TIGR03803 family)